MLDMERPRAVLLDVGGTLWPERFPPIVDRDALLLGRLREALPVLSEQAAASLLAEFDSRSGRLGAALTQDSDGLIAACAAQQELSIAWNEVMLARRALCIPVARYIAPFPGALELLEDIKRRGLRLVVVSNAITRDGETYLQDFAAFGSNSCIDGVVSSVDVGFRKPHLAMFETALRVAGCTPGLCVMAGNSEVNDIEPAHALGMRTVRVCIEEPPPVETAADAVVTSLNELAAVIEEWCAS